MSCNTPCAELLAASQTVTECMCIGVETYPFHCRLHGCEKGEHFHNLCRRDARYFRLWQDGEGPGQANVKRPKNHLPFGSWAAAAIKRMTFGSVAPCTGCKSRAAVSIRSPRR